MNNFVGAPTGIEPTSPAFRASVLTMTPQHPGTKCNKFASSNHPWQMVLQHVVITTVFLHTVRAPPILLYRHYSPDQLISKTRGPLMRDLSVHGDPNVNPKWNNMSGTS